ncbi:helix-turn-helix domain-containing protein [Devosia sp.]|uniref:TetR/AcrR family transcriptional regulator n=1 Tax=Devosia sp. TaxID=1871048 RepID=UPI0032673F93
MTEIAPDRHNQILEAALACFLERGYLATTIADIRQRSGATTGSIYHFFDGKGALAIALLTEAVALWLALSAEALDPDAPAEAGIKASVRGLVMFGLTHPALSRFMDEIRTLSSTLPEFQQVDQLLGQGQHVTEARYRQWAKAGTVRDLPWPIADALMLGPTYSFLRSPGPSGTFNAAHTAELLANAAWNTVCT